ncbi:hypothetical protein SARC_15993, partial [Sphaeroforma arctica JP610]
MAELDFSSSKDESISSSIHDSSALFQTETDSMVLAAKVGYQRLGVRNIPT